jgi:hypothetical protein
MQAQMSSSSSLVSFHAFLFPFEWKFQQEGPHITFEQKTDLAKLITLMGNNGHKWQRRGSWLDYLSVIQYNEANFFYDFVRPAMYDTRKDDSLLAHYYYRLPDPEHSEYIIEIKGGKTYRLEIDDIVVSFYDNGVGVLAFHLYNKREDQAGPEDIQLINQYGRRLYPPFLSADYDKIGTQEFFEHDDWEAGLADVKKRVLARSIRIESGGVEDVFEEFSDWAKAPDFEHEPGLVRDLFPPGFLKEIRLTPVIDDRMFVICWYGNDALSARIREKRQLRKDDWWYRFIFVDGDEMACQNPEMTKKLIEDHTNTRWTGYGTFYGVSRYSMVCLTQTMKTEPFARVICAHMQTMYYKIALLCLVQRAGVIRFSDEVTSISQLPEKDPHISKKVSSLYKQYLRFINKIYFREVTPQEQGIELYDLLHQHMRLDAQTKELEVEVRELNQYTTILEAERRNKKLDLLTYLGALLLGPSFIASFLGINSEFFDSGWHWISIMCVLSVGLAFGFVLTSGRWRTFFLVLLLGLMLFFLFPYIKMVGYERF